MKINVTDQDGNRHTLDAVEGWQVMEIIRDHGLPIKAECGGSCCCATCHVFVAPEWVERLHAMTEDEDDMLDETFDRDDTYSRLSCQLIMTEELDGLEVTLSPTARP